MDLIIISLIFLVVFVFLIAIIKTILSSSTDKTQYKYQRRSLLSKNELEFYKVLYPIASKNGLILFTKTRLADLIEPVKGSANWQGSFNKISQKHVDFILCDASKLNPVLIIELDDATHERANRQLRDEFVDQALKSAKIPILHTKTAKNIENDIAAKLSSKTTAKK